MPASCLANLTDGPTAYILSLMYALRTSFLCVTLLSAGLALSPIQAQTYTAQKVVFSDVGSFTQQQLEDAAAIHAGTSFSTAGLSAAAKRLADTGYFDNIGATVEGKFSSVIVKFDTKPTPTAHMLHVGFTNFVWLTPAQIDAAIKARFPLFNGYLPENSPHQEDIKAALTATLAEQSISAQVTCEEFEPTLRHPVQEVSFSISKPSIRVANVKLAGVTPALVPLIQKSVNSTAHTPYTAGPADLTTSDRILAPLLDAGYIEANLASVTVMPASIANGATTVILAATLEPGEIYRLSTISFAGTPIISAESFAAAAKLHPGDVASHAALLETLTPIDAAYRRQGYMDVVINAAPTLDSAAHTVAYAVSVQPGEQYRIHEVTANNLDTAARADFDRHFLLKPGDLYNPGYVAGFLTNNTAVRSLDGYSAAFKAYADPNTRTVDLVINFFRAGR